MIKIIFLLFLLVLLSPNALADRYGVTRYSLRIDGSYGRLEEGEAPYQIRTDEFRYRFGGTFPIGTYGGVEISASAHESEFNIDDAIIRSKEYSALFFLRDYDLGAVGLGYTDGEQKLGFDGFGLRFSVEDDIKNKFVELQYYLDEFTIGLRRGQEKVVEKELLGSVIHSNYFLAHASWYISDNLRMRLTLGGLDKDEFRRLTYSYLPNMLERKVAFRLGYGKFAGDHRAPFLEGATTTYIGATYFFNGGPTVKELDREQEGFLSTWY